MGTFTVPDDADGVNVTAADIRWTLGDPLPPVEQVDLLTLSERELFDYARALQTETAWLRAMLHEALAMVHRLTRLVDRQRRRIEELVVRLRNRTAV